ncbi:anti-sigma factor family protein [Streptomyces coeruleoprunus]|uniref:Anti-sigma factor family protein n=1 Tax=Streptomyces coeruleoprunus TaxID=285563 RepID=A0ABV9XNF2_9ACTN
MSGTGPTPAEQHLGDRLAALVDGELNHDARERVLAHLATCSRCKAEADAQRRVKSFFAQSAPPPPSAGLLARLQGLPGGAGGDDRPGGPGGPERLADGVFGVSAGSSVLRGATGAGFPIHEVGRQEAERSPWRGRRFAFAAASAVSFAAIALGGAMPTLSAVDARGEGSGNNVTPLRPSPGQGSTAGENSRRRGTSGGGTTVTLTGVPVQAHHPGARSFLTPTPLTGVPLIGPVAPTGLAAPSP